MNVLPENDSERGEILLATGLIDYFPNACAEVARHSAKSNAKHNPNQPMHWARDKSTDHRNKIARHLVDAGGFDKDGNRHSVALAWRGLAQLEDELIAEGATPGRNAIGSPNSDARKLYEETGLIAAAQDAKLSTCAESKARSCELLAECAREAQTMGLYANAGIPAESAYLASFGPNNAPPMFATLRDIPTTFTDSYGNGITRRIASQRVTLSDDHPLKHVTLYGPEDSL
jgi:hypothetical protein